MSNETKLQAWGTEYETYVVWGTHDTMTAMGPVANWLAENVGDSDLEDLMPATSDFEQAQRCWADPELLTMDEWPIELHSTVPVDGWVPYMVVAP